jgi:hypothetical protein
MGLLVDPVKQSIAALIKADYSIDYLKKMWVYLQREIETMALKTIQKW